LYEVYPRQDFVAFCIGIAPHMRLGGNMAPAVDQAAVKTDA
jgi:hypothetical protein